jgi:hypothetical protein
MKTPRFNMASRLRRHRQKWQGGPLPMMWLRLADQLSIAPKHRIRPPRPGQRRI